MDKLIELFMASGPAVLLIAATIFWGKNIIEYFFKETVEIKKQELQQDFEKFKLKLQHEQDNYKLLIDQQKMRFEFELKKESDFQLNKYQIQTIKINRVLPVLEVLNERIIYKQTLFDTYMNVLFNKGSFTNHEDDRVKLHETLLELTGKIEIYLPFELIHILYRIIKLSSNSFIIDGASLHRWPEFNHNRQLVRKFLQEAKTYLNSYWECYSEIVALYISEFDIKSRRDDRIFEILKLHKIDVDSFEIRNDDIDTKFIEDNLLMHEYRS